MNPSLNRREFTKATGILIAFSLGHKAAVAQQPTRLPGSLNGNRMLDAWIKINADGGATVCTGKVELGQGAVTALWQIAAEELDLPLARVSIVSGDTQRTPDEDFTYGSQSIENSGTALRLAAAEVRSMLVGLASERLNTPVEGLTVIDGVIAAADGRSVGYGQLAASVSLKREASAKVTPKNPAAYRIVGRSVARRDIPAKVTGGVAYVQDLRLPGMVHGRVVRPPRYQARLERYDEAGVKGLPGVIAVVRDGSFLAVVAEREEQAIKARRALADSAQWSGGTELPAPSKIYEQLLALPSRENVSSEKQAAPLAAGVSRGTTIEATYTRPYVAHAAIGPSCAVAEFKDGMMTVWTHTQGPFPTRRDMAKGLKLPLEQIRCVFMEGAGCYGRTGADDAAFEAALLAKAIPGRAVRLQWMRDDEFMWEPYGSAMLMKARASVAEGRIVDWQYDVWSGPHAVRPGDKEGNNLVASWYLAEAQRPSPIFYVPVQFGGASDRNAVPLYDLPNHRVVNHLVPELPFWVSSFRTLGGYANVFAVESFMDELAAAAGLDPVGFRLAHLKDERAKAVIETVARMSGWKEGEKGTGVRGRGIGFAKYKNLAAYVATVADVEVDAASGKVRVPRVWAATDAGLVINPDGLMNQIEGGIIQAVSWTLHEQVTFDRERILTRDWSSYPILTMPDVPKVETRLIDRPLERALGAGEASQGPVGAAVANAFAHATGRRLRDLPLSPERVKAALG